MNDVRSECLGCERAGQPEDRPGTETYHFGANVRAAIGREGHIEDTFGQVEDILSNAPCCRCVAELGLACVVRKWSCLPKNLRRAILVPLDSD